MSRVHEALRKAGTMMPAPPAAPPPAGTTPPPETVSAPQTVVVEPTVQYPRAAGSPSIQTPAPMPSSILHPHSLEGFISRIQSIPFTPSPDASLLDASRPSEAPAEEFRSLRTRLNHLQSLQPIHNVVITSASPAEGKSFTAANLALAQSHLEGNYTLLADFDFRRPILHSLFQVPRSPGITDYLQGKASLEDCIKRIEGTNLFILPAGEAVLNPLELLNLPEVRAMLDRLPTLFNWVILDTPPLLFAADANLLATLSHGLIMVVRVGSTTIDAVTRAIGSLCQNNILGIVVNGAHRGELYSKYAYYHSYYNSREE
jgi:protein-tyrosine kinase